MAFFHRFGFAVFAAFSLISSASAQKTTEPFPVTSLSMMVGQVRVFRASNPYKNVVVGQPEVADLNVMTDSRFAVTAKKEGLTSVLLTDEQGRPVQSLDIQVVPQVAYQKDSVRVRSFGSKPSESFYWCDRGSGCIPDPNNTPLVSESTTVMSLPGGAQAVTTTTTPVGPRPGPGGGGGTPGGGNPGGNIQGP